jgi:hypothetical protein
MTTTGRQDRAPGLWFPTGDRRRYIQAALRSAIIAGSVFTLAVVIGVLLAAAAPADLITEPTPAESAMVDPVAAATEPTATPHGELDATFARSLIFSGMAALAVSVAGSSIVLRHRRQW